MSILEAFSNESNTVLSSRMAEILLSSELVLRVSTFSKESFLLLLLKSALPVR